MTNLVSEKMHELFKREVENAEEYTLVYGLIEDVKVSNYIIFKKRTYTYTNLVIGYKNGNDQEIVFIKTTPEFDTVTEKLAYRRADIKKAYKIPMVNTLCVYKDKKDYIQFEVKPNYKKTDYNPEVSQSEECNAFKSFFETFKK